MTKPGHYIPRTEAERERRRQRDAMKGEHRKKRPVRPVIDTLITANIPFAVLHSQSGLGFSGTSILVCDPDVKTIRSLRHRSAGQDYEGLRIIEVSDDQGPSVARAVRGNKLFRVVSLGDAGRAFERRDLPSFQAHYQSVRDQMRTGRLAGQGEKDRAFRKNVSDANRRRTAGVAPRRIQKSRAKPLPQ